MYLPYSIDADRNVVKISDPPQEMDSQELLDWMAQVRDENADLYAELVTIYFKLRKTLHIDY